MFNTLHLRGEKNVNNNQMSEGKEIHINLLSGV